MTIIDHNKNTPPLTHDEYRVESDEAELSIFLLSTEVSHELINYSIVKGHRVSTVPHSNQLTI